MEDIDRRHLEAVIESISRNVAAHHEGSIHSYRELGSALRTLLCDTQRGKDNSLLPRCFKSPKLPKTRGTVQDKSVSLYIPARMRFDGTGRCDIEALFLPNPGDLPLQQWLQQPIIDAETDIRKLIRSVADKEGSHADPNPGSTLEKTHSVILGSRHTLTSKFIVEIAEVTVDYIAMRHLVERGDIHAKAISFWNLEGRGAVIVALEDFCRQGLQMQALSYMPIRATNLHGDARALLESYDPGSGFVLGRKQLNGSTINLTGWNSKN